MLSNRACLGVVDNSKKIMKKKLCSMSELTAVQLEVMNALVSHAKNLSFNLTNLMVKLKLKEIALLVIQQILLAVI